ncbi:CPBP family intramembrane glutamic endopeptidase [Candidatus Cardinium hertigii]|uniref:CPBP family intramembrane metalloprotease n=1 Tax=Candidatus Cardinium hertigii TaxID=247481 RepID=A0A3N2QBU1_9BACT|nr:CPBP family intramembrane glutamic endopeptidase [Candidatus Cardinium hertigii]ROT47042.1 CPBP family intramembrane metalloprotease [Candidatus Cardinium hertigii]
MIANFIFYYHILILLAITVIIALFCRNKKFLYISIVVTNMVGLYEDIINMVGLTALCGFGIMAYLYFHVKNYNNVLKTLLFIGLSTFLAGFPFHVIPGFFKNTQVQFVALLSSFSISLNFDKTMSALILYSIRHFYILEKKIDIKSLQQTVISLLICISLVLIPAFISGYVKFDPKIPSMLWIWAMNNFFFVCMAEEIIFRVFLQNTLKTCIGYLYKKVALTPANASAEVNGGLLKPLAKFDTVVSKNLHIIIASLLFGLVHLKGGIIYIIFATICGLCYGYTYDKTNRLICAMVVHFGLNLCHLLLFSYPTAV